MTGFNALIGASAVYLVADGTGVPETGVQKNCFH